MTASNFGRICKSSSNESLINIFKESNNKSFVKSDAINYGIINENIAISNYEERTVRNCIKSGLRIHKDYQFIAGSPDGLVSTDGLIEVKCPHLCNNLHPNDACSRGLIKYCDKRTGYLLKSHIYYYQVQVLLEITDRDWCDFVILTFKGIKIERIHRDYMFWVKMFPKLKKYFYFIMLPTLSGTQAAHFVKWRPEKDLTILPNGLVSDSAPYKDIGKRYNISFFNSFSCDVKEITREDFEILSGKSWLTNFVIYICLNIEYFE